MWQQHPFAHRLPFLRLLQRPPGVDDLGALSRETPVAGHPAAIQSKKNVVK
jgi:hypothetical protein